MKLAMLALVAAAAAACGGSGTTRTVAGGTGPKTEKPAAITPAAAREFEAAMRALRLGGPEAPATAKGRLKHALELDPSIWEAWYNLGVIGFGEGDDDDAAAAFTKALAMHAGHIPSLLGRAEARRHMGDKTGARADYEAAIKAADEDDPNRGNASARLASLLRDGGDFDDAVEVIRDSVRRSGASSKLYTELGLIYIAQKRLDLAQLVLAKAIELDAKDPAVDNALAILALRQGKSQEAFERFDQAVSLDASYVDARFNKASVLLDAGDYARAKTELSAIVDKHPDDFAAVVALGVAHRGMKDFPEAKKLFDRVIAEAPKKSSVRADAMFDVALLELDFINDANEGKTALERYLQEAPSDHAKRAAAVEKRKELGK